MLVDRLLEEIRPVKRDEIFHPAGNHILFPFGALLQCKAPLGVFIRPLDVYVIALALRELLGVVCMQCDHRIKLVYDRLGKNLPL